MFSYNREVTLPILIRAEYTLPTNACQNLLEDPIQPMESHSRALSPVSLSVSASAKLNAGTLGNRKAYLIRVKTSGV